MLFPFTLFKIHVIVSLFVCFFTHFISWYFLKHFSMVQFKQKIENKIAQKKNKLKVHFKKWSIKFNWNVVVVLQSSVVLYIFPLGKNVGLSLCVCVFIGA